MLQVEFTAKGPMPSGQTDLEEQDKGQLDVVAMWHVVLPSPA